MVQTDFPDVRRALGSDAERLAALWLQLLEEQAALDERLGVAEDALVRWQNDFPMWIGDETCRIYVAAPDDTLLGFATAHRWGPPPIYEASSEVYLDELFVVPHARRRGLGSQLVAAVCDWTDRIGARRIRLSVLAANEAGRSFWAAQGGRPMTCTLTIERPGGRPGEESSESKGSKKIGF